MGPVAQMTALLQARSRQGSAQVGRGLQVQQGPTGCSAPGFVIRAGAPHVRQVLAAIAAAWRVTTGPSALHRLSGAPPHPPHPPHTHTVLGTATPLWLPLAPLPCSAGLFCRVPVRHRGALHAALLALKCDEPPLPCPSTHTHTHTHTLCRPGPGHHQGATARPGGRQNLLRPPGPQRAQLPRLPKVCEEEPAGGPAGASVCSSVCSQVLARAGL